jgi:TonB family protein
VQGVVTLKAQIGKDGSVENLELMSGHPLLAPAAIDAAKQWKYKPYLANGQPIPVETEIQLDFKLAVEPQPAVVAPPALPNSTAQIYHVGAGVSAPSIISARQPDYTDEANRARKEGKVVLSVVVDTAGHAQNLRIVTPLGYGLDEKAVEAVRQWRFQPGMKDGKPVNVQINVEVEFHEY